MYTIIKVHICCDIVNFRKKLHNPKRKISSIEINCDKCHFRRNCIEIKKNTVLDIYTTGFCLFCARSQYKYLTCITFINTYPMERENVLLPQNKHIVCRLCLALLATVVDDRNCAHTKKQISIPSLPIKYD